MRKKIINIFILFLTVLSYPSFAEDNIFWKLGTNIGFIEEVKELNKNKESKAKGIEQLLYRSEVKLEKDKVYRHVSVVWHFTDAASMQDYGTDDIYFREESETITILEAGSINGKGEVIQFNPANLHIKNSENYNTFSSSKRVLIPFPSLEIGGIAFLNYITEVDRSKLEGHWSYTFYPKNNFPRKSLDLSFQSSLGDFNWNSSSKFVNCDKSGNTLQCLGENIPAQISNDSYRWRDELGQLVVSEGKDWKNVIDITMDAFNHSKTNTQGVDEILTRLTGNKTQLEEKITAIHDFVINDIRYISDVKNGHSYTPHTVTETLSNRYGDCKDKSALFIELLKGIGINAYPVLVSTNREDPSVLKAPSMGYFNHMVACFPLDGKEMCVDATDNSTDWDDVASWIQGKVSLKLTEGSNPETIPKKEYLWEMRAGTDNTLVPETNKLNERQTRAYNSQYAAYFRRQAEGKSEKEINDWMTNYYNENVSSSVKPKIKVKGLNDLNAQVTMISDVDYEMSLDSNDDLVYKDNDAWVLSNLSDFSVRNEQYKTHLQGMKIISTNKFDISKTWRISGLYPRVNIDHKFGKMVRFSDINSESRNEQNIEFTTTVEIPSQTISIEEKEEFNKFIALLKRESRLRVFGTKVE